MLSSQCISDNTVNYFQKRMRQYSTMLRFRKNKFYKGKVQFLESALSPMPCIVPSPIFFNSFISSSKSSLPRSPYHKVKKRKTIKLQKLSTTNPSPALPVAHKVKIPKIPIRLKTKKIKRKLRAVDKDLYKDGPSNISLSSVNKTPTHTLQKTLISYSAMKQNGRRNDNMLYFKSSLFPIYQTAIT